MTEPSHPAFVRPAAVAMVVVVLAIGSVLAWQIIANPGVATIEVRGGALAQAAEALPVALGTGNADQGLQIAAAQCSGCHTTDRRLIGPSWASIAARYDPATDAISRERCIPRIVTAVEHPRPGWDGYPPGPAMSLSRDDRAALATFILERGGKS